MRTAESKIQYLIIAIVAFTVACGSTQVKVKKVENLRPDFVDTVGRNSKILVIALPAPAMKDDIYGDYLSASEDAGSSDFSYRNYFETIPAVGAEARSLAANRNYGAIKQKYKVDTVFLISQPTQPPAVSCALRSETRYRNGNCKKWETKRTTSTSGTATTEECVQYEKVPYQVSISEIAFSGKVTGNLINLNNGKKITVTSEPRVSTTEEGALCEGTNSGLRQRWSNLVRRHVDKLVENVSPLAKKISVPIWYTVEGIADTPENQELLKTVKESLSQSKTLADNGQLDEAAKIWLDVDQKTGGKSACAAWNLAVYNWNNNNLKAAKTYAEQSFAAGSPDWQAKIKEAKDIIEEQNTSLKIKK